MREALIWVLVGAAICLAALGGCSAGGGSDATMSESEAMAMTGQVAEAV